MATAQEKRRKGWENQRKCNGKSRRTGEPCRSIAMKNGKCRLHGGKVKGAPKGSKNRATPGSMYSKFKSQEELQILAELRKSGPAQNLEKDIEDAYIRKRRLVNAYDKAVQEAKEEELRLVQKEVTTSEDGAQQVKETFRQVDYLKKINEAEARLESLLKTREAILAAQKSDNTLVIVGGLPDLSHTLDVTPENRLEAIPEGDDADT